MNEIDSRIVRISVEVNNKLNVYEGSNGLSIKAVGSKSTSTKQNECTVTIVNLSQSNRDFLLTATSPFNANKTPKQLIVEAGRESYGYSTVFVGNITSANISQPPDIALTLKCLTANYQKGNMIGTTQANNAKLSDIAKSAAESMNLNLLYQAIDKQVVNYQFSGSNTAQISGLKNLSNNLDVYIDNNQLIVKNSNKPLATQFKVIDMDSGMIGIPELTEQGVKVKYFLDNFSRVGGGLTIKSQLNPAANGDYLIYKLDFDIANRDVPFYYTAEAKRL